MPRRLPWEDTEREFLADLPRPPTTPGRLRGKMCLSRIPNPVYRYLVAAWAKSVGSLLYGFPVGAARAPTEVLRDYLDFPEDLKLVQGPVDRNGHVSVWLDTYLGMLAVGHYRVDPAE